MTETDPLATLRAKLPRPGEDTDLDPAALARIWQAVTTWDAAEGRDQLTGDPLDPAGAVVVVGPMSHSVLVAADTWAERRQDVAEQLTGYPILSTVTLRDLLPAAG